MTCATCKAALDDDARFCPKCGRPAAALPVDAPDIPGHALVASLPPRGAVERHLVQSLGTGARREARVVRCGDDTELAAVRAREQARARLLESVRDDALPRVHHAATTAAGDLIVVTDRPDGECLAERLEALGPLAASDVAGLVDDLAGALAVVAAAGWTVESIDAADVLLTRRGGAGERPRAFLLGLSLAEPGTPLAGAGPSGPSETLRAATRSLAVLAWAALETPAGGGGAAPAVDRGPDGEGGETVRSADSDQARARSLLARTVGGRRRGATTPLELAAALTAAARRRSGEVRARGPSARPRPAPQVALRRTAPWLLGTAAAVVIVATGLLVHSLREGSSATQASLAGPPLQPTASSSAGAAASGSGSARPLPVPRDAVGLHSLAAERASEGEPETAAALFDAAVMASRLGADSGHPARADLLCDAAVAWAALADLERAAMLLDQALRLQPGHARARANRAALALAAGRPRAAEADARAALASEDGLAVARAALIGALRAQGRQQEAIEVAADSVARGIDSAGLCLQRAALAEDGGDLALAREQVALARRLAPGAQLAASR